MLVKVIGGLEGGRRDAAQDKTALTATSPLACPPGDAVPAIYRALAVLFTGLGMLAVLTYLPLYDGYLPSVLRAVDQFVPAVIFLAIMAAAFFALAARCHLLGKRRRYRRWAQR